MTRITVLPDVPYRVSESLTIEVEEIVEKRLTDGNGMMRIGLRLLTPDSAESVCLTSREPQLRWKAWQMSYLGGWRSQVDLEIDGVSDIHQA